MYLDHKSVSVEVLPEPVVRLDEPCGQGPTRCRSRSGILHQLRRPNLVIMSRESTQVAVMMNAVAMRHGRLMLGRML